METLSASLAICAGNSPVLGEFSAQRPVARSFDVFFDLHPNLRLSKQSWGWWFETPSRQYWRHCNGMNSCQWDRGTIDADDDCTFAVLYTVIGNSRYCQALYSSKPEQNVHHIADDIQFRCVIMRIKLFLLLNCNWWLFLTVQRYRSSQGASNVDI